MAIILDITLLKNTTVSKVSTVLFTSTICWIDKKLRFREDTWDVFPQDIVLMLASLCKVIPKRKKQKCS